MRVIGLYCRLFAVSVCLLLGLSACATYPENSVTLEEVLDSSEVVSLPIQFRKNGIIIVKGVDVDGQKLDFMLDTGATRSAIFEKTQAKIPQAKKGGPVNVHGIANVEQVESIIVPEMKIGEIEFSDRIFVVLPNRNSDPNFEKHARLYDGLIGMDFLEKYALHLDRENSQIHFIPNRIKTRVPRAWMKADLYENPFGADARKLHFFSAVISQRKVPALLDTGLEISVINWNEKSYPLLRRFKRKLRADWELQGAVGSFEPRMKVNLQDLSAGSVTWSDKTFIAMRLDNLKVLGLRDDNMIIAGANLLDHKEVFIDFENNILAVKPGKGQRSIKPIIINPY